MAKKSAKKRLGLVILAFVGIACGSSGCASHPPLPPQAIELNRTGAEALATGNFELAAARLALAIEYSPRFTEAWVNLGLLQLQKGEHEASRRSLKHARDLNPNLPTPHHALGLWAEAHDQGPDAEKFYRAALKVDPGFSPARANLARLVFRRADWDEAREQFLRLTEAAPEAIEGWTGLVESYLRLGREADADRVLDTAATTMGDRPEIALLRARQWIRRGEFERAERALSGLLSDGVAERRAAVMGFIAVARLGRGDVPRAVEAAREALTIDGRQAVALFVLGQTR
jgi:tetratricopeptide (TPR) repeat protein